VPDFAQTAPFSVELSGGRVLRGSRDGDGDPLVLLHGLSATRRYVTQGSRLLARGGHSLIGYDARGHGESDPAPERTAYTYPDLVGDLRAVLDSLGLDRPALAGSSMGAHTAVAFALAEPDRVGPLILITPGFDGSPLGEEALAAWAARADALVAGDIDRFAELAAGDVPPGMADTVRLAIRQRIERHRHPAAVADALRATPCSQPFEGLDRLAEIRAPTLVVGSRDELDPTHPLATAREYADRIPGAELAIEDEGKSPLAWQGAQLSRRIKEFLDPYS
jgi:pimeloyl-ACP methyl ester carboxylesterase